MCCILHKSRPLDDIHASKHNSKRKKVTVEYTLKERLKGFLCKYFFSGSNLFISLKSIAILVRRCQQTQYVQSLGDFVAQTWQSSAHIVFTAPLRQPPCLCTKQTPASHRVATQATFGICQPQPRSIRDTSRRKVKMSTKFYTAEIKRFNCHLIKPLY